MRGEDRPVDDVVACQRMFADFAKHSTSSAPLYARLSTGIAADAELSALLLDAPPRQRLPVLLFASVHWLLIGDPDQPLARFYPSLHPGARPDGDPVEAFRAFCIAHRDQIGALLRSRRTQTNEIGRTSLFVPAFAQLDAETGPLAHIDVGASAGLNLLLGHYDHHYEPGGAVVTGSRVSLTCATRGSPPIPHRHPLVAAALGLDSHPVDLTDPDQAAWLEACVWPDQRDRFVRLAAAIDIATEVGVEVREGDAVDDVGAAVDSVRARGHPVVTTSWVLNYLTSAERSAFVGALDDVGERADLSWVYAENPVLCPELPGVPRRNGDDKMPTAVVMVRWRDGVRSAIHLADAHPHGVWMNWITTTRS